MQPLTTRTRPNHQAQFTRWWLILALLLGCLGVGAGPALPAAAASLTVTNGNDSGAGSLRATIAAAAAGDTITFAAGVTTVTLTSTNLTIAKNLTIQGPSGGSVSIERSTVSGTPNFGILSVTAGTVTLNRLAIRKGREGNLQTFGGGLYVTGAGTTVNLNDSSVNGNTTAVGGGIAVFNNATLQVSNSSVFGNGATGDGGGGGMYVSSGTLNVTNSAINANIVTSTQIGVSGGGIILVNSTANITGSTIANNSVSSATGYGGGLSFSNSTANILGTTIAGNSAGNSGGGIEALGNNTITLTNSTISGNTAGKYGGGVYLFNGLLNLRFTTVTGNAANSTISSGGGGIFRSSNGAAVVNLESSIVAGNKHGASATAPQADCGNTGAGAIVSQNHNVVGGGTGCPSNSSADATIAPAGVGTVLSPTLADNGGPTFTHALVAGSSAIDRVPTNACAAAAGKDQIGNARPVGNACDSGAVETSAAGPAPCGQAFADVAANDPACAAIEALAARGVIKGCDQEVSPPLFCPGDNTLRAQMAALIVRAMSWSSETPSNPFTDKCDLAGSCVDDELWNAVGVLAAKSVAKGYTDAATCEPATAPCYAPRDNVLYAQTISFITRAMVKKGYWTQAIVDDTSVYPNIPASSGHRLDFVTYVANVGPVPGTTAKTQNFDQWNQPSTRSWFALALWQAIKDR